MFSSFHPVDIYHVVGFPTAPEVEYMTSKPQGRIRRDSLQVSTIYVIKTSHSRRRLQLILCFLLCDRAIKWTPTLQGIA